MDINEARSKNQPLCIDNLFGFGRIDLSDSDNAAIFDSHICAEPGISRTVNDTSVRDYKLERMSSSKVTRGTKTNSHYQEKKKCGKEAYQDTKPFSERTAACEAGASREPGA
jgi:hypothetical protein